MSKPGRTLPRPLVTIVTPSFNQGEFIANAIDSVLAQDYPQLEYMVIDGGSTDATLDVLRSYKDRIRWSSGPDAGQADAIHRGFLAATGEYLAWLNADDRYAPGAIGAAVQGLAVDPSAALVYGEAEFIDREGVLTGPCEQIEPWNLERLIEVLDFVVQPATVFRRDAYLAVGGLDPTLHYCMDYDLWIRLGSKYPVRFLPELLAQVRVYGQTKTATGGLRRLEEIERMIRRNGGQGLPTGFRPEMWPALRLALVDATKNQQFMRAARLVARTAPYAARAAFRKLQRGLSGGRG